MKTGLERRARNLYHDPSSGQWHVRVMINGDSIVRVFDTRRQADAAIIALKHRKTAEQLGLVVAGGIPTLAACVADYIDRAEIRGVAPGSLENYRRYARHFARIIGARRSPALTNGDVLDYVRTRRREGVSVVTVLIEVRFLHTAIKGTVGQAFLTWAVPKLYDPAQAAPRPIPTDASIAATFTALEGSSDLRRAFLIALLTALRQSDACSLLSSDIVDGVILTGMRKRRGSPIAVPVVDTLAAALEGVDGPLTPPPEKVVAAIKWRTRHLSPPINGLGFLRSTAATWASAAGFTDENVGVLLGHRTSSVARRHYIRASMPLRDSFIDVRRSMLEAVESRFVRAIQTKK